MKLTALAVVILALGVVVGFALAGGASEGPASAAPQCPGPSSQCPTPTPAPLQQREDQIAIFATHGTLGIGGNFGPNWLLLSEVFGSRVPIVALDTADYPPNADFRFESVFIGNGCIRLFDLTAAAPISGSEVCGNQTGPSFGLPQRLRTGALQLQNGERDYTIQILCDGCVTVEFNAGRIIAEWTE